MINVIFAAIVVIAIFTSPHVLWLTIPLIFWQLRTQSTTPYDTSYIPPTIDTHLANFLYMKHQYLNSPQWKLKRNKVLARDSHYCQNCASTQNLTVHHMSGYALIPNEPTTCLITLCSSCHTLWHEKFGYPQTYSDYMNWDH